MNYNACIFCGVLSENCNIMDLHHVLNNLYFRERKDQSLRQFRRFSLKQSLVLPVCRTCHDAYHRSLSFEEFLIRLGDDNVRKTQVTALREQWETTLFHAIKLSFIIPMIRPDLCNQNYYSVCEQVSYENNDILKCLESIDVSHLLWGQPVIFKYRTKKESGYIPYHSSDWSIIRVEAIKTKILIYLSSLPVKRHSEEALKRYLNRSRSKKQYPIKFSDKEFDEAFSDLINTRQIKREMKVIPAINFRYKDKCIVFYKTLL